jgi:hypothetical protein
MASNASIFDAPPISMPTFRTQINELESAQINTYDRAKSATIIRNQKRAIIKASLVTLSWYVNSVSNGDEAIMNLAGMAAAARGPYRYDSIDKPKNLRGFSPYTGAVKIRWSVVSNAAAYIVEYCSDPATDTEWKNCFNNRSANAEMGGLESGKKYWFRVRAIGARGLMSDWSDPICILVS